MTIVQRSTLAALIAVTVTAPLMAQQNTLPWRLPSVFSIPQTGVNFLTGDTWEQNGRRLRLYGVQSCIRGTTFTNAAGAKQDCGEASLAIFAAWVRDAHPTCSPVAQLPASQKTPPVTLAVCAVHIGISSRDLGTVLINQGFAFAAFTNQGQPVYKLYQVAEELARKNKVGLWAYPDFTHPNAVLSQAVNISR